MRTAWECFTGSKFLTKCSRFSVSFTKTTKHGDLSMKWRGYGLLLCGLLTTAVCWAADGSWLKHVSEADREKVNPFAAQPDSIQAGKKVYLDHCAKCHGEDGAGRRKKPSLRSTRV